VRPRSSQWPSAPTPASRRRSTATSSPARRDQYNQFSGGNPELDPEEADTYTFGFVTTPIDSLQISLDYYDIEITDRIGTIGARRSCGSAA
jgi:iron complex outermembrane recepter protein